MKPVTAIIKNMDGHSDGLIWELSRSGAPEGTLINGVVDWKKKAVYFTSDLNDKCVAYMGQTCFIVTPLTESEICEGTVVHKRDSPYVYYVITKVLPHTVVLKYVTNHQEDRIANIETRQSLLKEYFWVRRMQLDEYETSFLGCFQDKEFIF